MDQSDAMQGPPRSILLATDLGPRCDQALDRAIVLSRQWQAKLIIIHVLADAEDGEQDSTVSSWRQPSETEILPSANCGLTSVPPWKAPIS